jgi:hypothetical protein
LPIGPAIGPNPLISRGARPDLGVAHALHYRSSPILVALQGDTAMRKTTPTLSLLSFLVAAATGCAADVAGPDDVVDPTDPTNPTTRPTRPEERHYQTPPT